LPNIVSVLQTMALTTLFLVIATAEALVDFEQVSKLVNANVDRKVNIVGLDKLPPAQLMKAFAQSTSFVTTKLVSLGDARKFHSAHDWHAPPFTIVVSDAVNAYNSTVYTIKHARNNTAKSFLMLFLSWEFDTLDIVTEALMNEDQNLLFYLLHPLQNGTLNFSQVITLRNQSHIAVNKLKFKGECHNNGMI